MDTNILIDPVCLMKTNEQNLYHQYHQKKIFFCSEQCRQRFINNPQLYLSDSGHLPTKKSLGKLIYQRTLTLQNELNEQQAEQLLIALHSMMGIIHAALNKNQLCIRYDLLQATIEQIEDRIEQAGNKLNHSLGEHLKRIFIHYREKTELDNLEQDVQDTQKHCH